MKKINVSKLLELVWKYIDYDIHETIYDAVHKVLIDKGTDNFTSNINSQVNGAKALSILAHSFYSIGQTFSNKDNDDKKNDKVLKEQIGIAFFQVFLQQRNKEEDDDEYNTDCNTQYDRNL